jgi:hypothetical protein
VVLCFGFPFVLCDELRLSLRRRFACAGLDEKVDLSVCVCVWLVVVSFKHTVTCIIAAIVAVIAFSHFHQNATMGMIR